MSCAIKAASEEAARMRAACEQVNLDSAAGDVTPAAVDKQPASPNVAGERGHPRAASSSAALAAGSIPMDVDSEIEVIYSGESDSLFDSKAPAKHAREAVSAEPTTAEPSGDVK